MNIGIDIDDTVSETTEIILEYIRKFNKGDSNEAFLLLSNIEDYKNNEFIKKYYTKMLNEVKIKADAVKNINKLKMEGNKIIFISSRWQVENSEITNITEKWLKGNNVQYDYVYTNIQDKVEIIKKHNIKLFIDDNIKHCINVRDNTKTVVYIMNSKLNSQSEAKGITRVFDWNEIYRLVKTSNEFKTNF